MKRRLTTTKRSRNPRRHTAWFVAVALVFNLAAGFMLPGSVSAAVSEAGVSIGGDINTVVICSPNGVRVMKIGPNGEPLPEPPHRDMNCVHCLSLNGSHGCGLCAHALLPDLPVSPNASPSEAYGVLAIASDVMGTHGIRAPPSFQ